ncbi:GNAT family N-acetyltransferase [Trinickia caryophylli]|uniref:Protein N-acetyltransferase, RimJ/RimL family n=2 Tax=Trinickia caryophylli TaxID=28094 RepID=A0A1X7D507_TRICW|nr:GNAT family N-acetyltransferase [Trinickia caryophylli]WQE14993.1 GNAT family N-acetyltransferase [Trinickia caryophylli]SMF09054.1 Protein N-acetyltransferase, RimJ/RimL family [Trinickia caryophylli]
MMDRVADLDCDALPAVDECRASDVRATDCGPNPSLDTAEDGAPWMSMRDVCSELHAPEPLGDTLAGPAWADVWARAIVFFWQTEHDAGMLDSSESVVILDFAPGSGALAWLMRLAIDEQLQRSTLPALRVCYIACTNSETDAEALRSSERLNRPVGGDLFRVAHWHIEEGAIRLAARGDYAWAHGVRAGPLASINVSANPAVVLGAGFFGCLPADLFAACNGEWIEGRARFEAAADAPGGRRLNYQCQPAGPGEGALQCGPPWDALIEHYRRHLVNAPVLLPTEAFTFVKALRQTIAGRYLLLACDVAACSENEIRDGALAPPQPWVSAVSGLPVNYHALAWHEDGAWCGTRRVDEGGLALYAAWSRGGMPPSRRASGEMDAILSGWSPFDAGRLARAAATVPDDASFDMALALLRTSRFDPRVLGAIGGRVQGGMPLRPESRLAWGTALERAWRAFLPHARAEDVELGIGSAAMALDRWDIARDAFAGALARGGEPLAAHYYLAFSLASSGRLQEALHHARRACAIDPNHAACRALEEELSERVRRRSSFDWYRPECARDGSLSIEPLGPEHARALTEYVGPPHIALMANLETLDDEEQALAWIDTETRREAKMNCAIVDERFGFVGIVSLFRAATSGDFYFWLRADLQGKGMGVRAARCLFSMAHAAGVTDFFTTVYEGNGYSERALARLGFRRLPIREDSNANVGYFHRTAQRVEGNPDLDVADIIRRLLRYCDEIGQPLRLCGHAAAGR